MAEEGRVATRRLRIELSDLLLEIISIVIAIVLATAVGQVVAQHREGVQTAEALRQIRSEIQTNRAALERVRPLHVRIAAAYEALVGRAHHDQIGFAEFRATFARAAPHGINPFRGEDTAWQLARTSSTISNAPYSVRAAVQRAYFEQETLDEIDRTLFQTFLTPPTTSRPNFYFIGLSLSLEFNDAVGSERRLDARYGEALAALAHTGIH